MLYLIEFLLFLLLLAALALPFYRNQEVFELDELEPEDLPGQHVQLSLGVVHFHRVGQKTAPTVILVHGFAAFSYVWERNVNSLVQQGYQVISLDLYGRGYSARPNTCYSRQLFVDQIVELLDDQEIQEPVYLAGLSMGGAICVSFAEQYPHRVAGLILLAPLNTPPHISPMPTPIIGEYVAYSFFVPNLAKKQLEDLSNPENALDWAEQFEPPLRYFGYRRALLATLRDLMQEPMMASYYALADKNIPCLLLWGTADKQLPVSQAGKVKEALGSHCELVLVQGAGHALQYEHSEQVNQHIAGFLAIQPK
ncbi:alpha/beta fold hydrolase [Agarivorans sp. 1_MG-2023]|uniref:alpha/beta fold hydrolase n=1 Tax=Agarivorans sp. 1_MG-2023 TaxID=3062634 RepID=UPI0026E4274C|nr:alpha/beta hydrolase [Agarivorans sp. 1_MG-2023]MDO6765970.1 alpha/beta hydrolase [Agarivorans sp. 1_MG-2023]